MDAKAVARDAVTPLIAWERGLNLWGAIAHYANRQTWTDYKAIDIAGAMERASTSAQQHPLVDAFTKLTPLVNEMTKQSQLVSAMQYEIKRYLGQRNQ